MEAKRKALEGIVSKTGVPTPLAAQTIEEQKPVDSICARA
jgi:hypothetical protein